MWKLIYESWERPILFRLSGGLGKEENFLVEGTVNTKAERWGEAKQVWNMTPKQREHRRGWGARQGLILPDLQAVGMSYLNEFIPQSIDEKPLKSFKVGGWHNLIYMLRKLHRWLHGGWNGEVGRGVARKPIERLLDQHRWGMMAAGLAWSKCEEWMGGSEKLFGVRTNRTCDRLGIRWEQVKN